MLVLVIKERQKRNSKWFRGRHGAENLMINDVRSTIYAALYKSTH